MQDVNIPLTEPDIVEHLLGREVYRRTEYLALRHDGATALVWVRKASLDPLMSPVVEATWLAGPDQVDWIESPDTDVGNASALASAVHAKGRPGALAHVVQGRYEHVNFLWMAMPITIRVTEVVPPEPAKLHDQARRVVEFDEDLPPIELRLDVVRVPDLAASHPAASYLLPCRGSGVDLPSPVAFLDTRPADRQDWTLIGCERSMQFHRHFYGDEPPQVDLCPLARVRAGVRTDELVLTKCCLLERGVEITDGLATVPWGASLDEVRAAVRLLVGLDPAPRVRLDEAATTT